ncbi:hypothetical protein [Planococcus halotolerans]|uniref:hypothetical protein n=1 Tax=Planococcus halotolerans TaxID=2233542 RepID=UPI00136745A1|nr:hypothetical protein [Planococcus halotolerans]QHJ70342.1 hypothetical protein DNR44_006880 [Planococcus halotolerans]
MKTDKAVIGINQIPFAAFLHGHCLPSISILCFNIHIRKTNRGFSSSFTLFMLLYD